MKTVEMPKMGDTMEEGKILRWLKQEGDKVKKGEMLAEVETDKVNIEIEAFSSGVLRKILVPEGEAAPIGAGIALIGTAEEPLPDNFAGRHLATTPMEMERAETTTEVPAQSPTAPPTLDVADTPAERLSHLPGGDTQGRVFISPIARRMAAEHALDYRQIRGTGPNGRIIKLDIEAALARGAAAGVPVAPVTPVVPPVQTQPVPVSAAPAIEPEAAPAGIDSGEVVEIPLTSMRRTIARRLSQSMQTAPHFYVTSVIDTGKLAALRAQINEYAASEINPIKVSFTDLIVKAAAIALGRIPQVNVSFAEDRLLQKKAVHLGIAVALETGLIVPVLKNADKRGVLDIARESKRLAEAARTGKLKPEDFSGGTFTVSNLGMYDVESFTAIINPPESAILAVGSIVPTPAVVDGQVVVRERMKVTLSSDHRAIDGAIAARFLQEIKRLLEEPFGLLL